MEAPLSGPLNNEDEAKKAATWEFVKFLVFHRRARLTGTPRQDISL